MFDPQCAILDVAIDRIALKSQAIEDVWETMSLSDKMGYYVRSAVGSSSAMSSLCVYAARTVRFPDFDPGSPGPHQTAKDVPSRIPFLLIHSRDDRTLEFMNMSRLVRQLRRARGGKQRNIVRVKVCSEEHSYTLQDTAFDIDKPHKTVQDATAFLLSISHQ